MEQGWRFVRGPPPAADRSARQGECAQPGLARTICGLVDLADRGPRRSGTDARVEHETDSDHRVDGSAPWQRQIEHPRTGGLGETATGRELSGRPVERTRLRENVREAWYPVLGYLAARHRHDQAQRRARL